MAIPQGTGWDWLSRTRNLVWLGSFIVAGAVAVWTEVDGLPPSVIAVFALAAFVRKPAKNVSSDARRPMSLRDSNGDMRSVTPTLARWMNFFWG